MQNWCSHVVHVAVKNMHDRSMNTKAYLGWKDAYHLGDAHDQSMLRGALKVSLAFHNSVVFSIWKKKKKINTAAEIFSYFFSELDQRDKMTLWRGQQALMTPCSSSSLPPPPPPPPKEEKTLQQLESWPVQFSLSCKYLPKPVMTALCWKLRR